ncbi:carcinoembryonic antigen-related cell adhesion molecule 1 isoform X2 [Paramisgurnus dabryanus]|uniref:carcinoembryonic antigen-related cell adhesion molecule 1 isoform X2 n=1 Tax=Paramisgurnus dabryanus TaxID=90735 RepID=UPI003CCF3667
MEFKLLVFFILILPKGLTAVTLQPSANPVRVGTNVTIKVIGSTSSPAGAWLFGPSVLFVWYSGSLLIGSSFENGIAFNNTTYDLFLPTVTLNSSGLYVFEDIGVNRSKAELILDVQEPISAVSTGVSKSNLMELNDSVTFTCSASGTPMWISWQNGSSLITAWDRIVLSNGGQVLTINPVMRYDQGPFKCIVANNISNGESTQVSLNISYGPSNMRLTALPDRIAYASGSAISLSCMADSNPPASMSWTYNDVPLNVSGSNLQINNLTPSKSGQYTCVARNAVTFLYATVTKSIRILESISQVMVNPQAGYPIENASFSLSCNIVGSMGSIQWMKNSLYLVTDSRITFSNQNLTLSINQLNINDNGQYTCVASNDVSNMSSLAYNFKVNYGPRNVAISGPDVSGVGSIVTFNCSADSQPQSQYSWYFNGVKVDNRSVYTTGALTVSNTGRYICMAYNNITGQSSNASKDLTVIVPISAITVTINNQQPVFNQSFTLTCNIVGDVSSIQWMKNGLPLYANSRITFSSTNSTLSFNPLNLNDGGQYQCAVRNLVSNMTSMPYNLTVNYGPWNLTISGPTVGAVGSNVTFSCSANSQPASQYSWIFNGTNVGTASVLVIRSLAMNNRGQYTCVAYNNITMSNSSASVNLTVINYITAVSVNLNNQQPVLNQSFSLTCGVSGDVYSIQWMKNGLPVYPNNMTTFSSNNSTLTLNQLSFNDAGQYQCAVVNPFGNMTGNPYNLTVNYGPWSTTISGPTVGAVGSNMTLSCSAISQPASQYSWFFNGTNVGTASVLVIRSLAMNNRGQYTCVAYNNITMSNSTASVNLTVINYITAVSVNLNNQQPVLNQSFSLTCGVSGDVYSIQWMKNGLPVYPNNMTTFSSNNSTLTLNQLSFNDAGQYQCAVVNPFGNMTGNPYNLTVNYGPWSTTISGPTVGAVGSNVTLNCSAISQPASQYSWFFNGTNVGTASVLVIRSLTMNNRGLYTCVASNNITMSNSSASVNLTVINYITAVSVNLNNQQPVLNQSFSLTCGVNGDVYSIQWMKNGLPMYPNNMTTFSSNNSTLTLNQLSLNDAGQYQCTVVNPFGNMTGNPYNLTVNYGPWSTTISGPTVGAVGSNVTFSCSAISQPASQYSWFFNGTNVGTASVLVIRSLAMNNRGLYTCVAYNNITMSNSSASVALTVINSITAVSVNLNNQQPVFNQSFSLTCGVSGDVSSIQWMKNGLPVYPNNMTTFSSNNSTLILNQLSLNDAGQYQCVVVNPVGNMTGMPYNLTVNYGPSSPTITGPSVAEVGNNVTFNCSADSRPASQYTWFFNGLVVANSSVYVMVAVTLNNTGWYTCMAYNSITQTNNSATLNFTVYEGITSVYVSSNPLIPKDSENLILTCKVNGSYNSVSWLKNSQTLQTSDRVAITGEKNNTLNFTPLKTADNAVYHCIATNPVRSYTSQQYNVVANYGPVNVKILVDPGYMTTLTCSAESQPAAVYQWIVNNGTVLTYQATIEIPIQNILGYNYTCVARNPLTNTIVYTSHFIGDYPNASVSVHASVMLTALLALLLIVLNECM